MKIGLGPERNRHGKLRARAGLSASVALVIDKHDDLFLHHRRGLRFRVDLYLRWVHEHAHGLSPRSG